MPQQQQQHFHTVGPTERQRLGQSFASAALRAQRRAIRAKAMGNQCGWVHHLNQASRLSHKADLLGA